MTQDELNNIGARLHDALIRIQEDPHVGAFLMDNAGELFEAALSMLPDALLGARARQMRPGVGLAHLGTDDWYFNVHGVPVWSFHSKTPDAAFAEAERRDNEQEPTP